MSETRSARQDEGAFALVLLHALTSEEHAGHKAARFTEPLKHGNSSVEDWGAPTCCASSRRMGSPFTRSRWMSHASGSSRIVSRTIVWVTGTGSPPPQTWRCPSLLRRSRKKGFRCSMKGND